MKENKDDDVVLDPCLVEIVAGRIANAEGNVYQAWKAVRSEGWSACKNLSRKERRKLVKDASAMAKVRMSRT